MKRTVRLAPSNAPVIKYKQSLEDARVVVSDRVLGDETGSDLAEDHAGLGLVVGDIAGVFDELVHIDVREREASNLGDKLRVLEVSRGKTTLARGGWTLHASI